LPIYKPSADCEALGTQRKSASGNRKSAMDYTDSERGKIKVKELPIFNFQLPIYKPSADCEALRTQRKSASGNRKSAMDYVAA
jgi:hypothetical protein